MSRDNLLLDPEVVKALANEKRLLILEWLRDPEAHFPAQRDGDLVRDGVCSLFIADKLGVSQPTGAYRPEPGERVALVITGANATLPGFETPPTAEPA